MSKLQLDKINFQEDDFEVVVAGSQGGSQEHGKDAITLNRAEQQANETIEAARLEASKIISEANKKATDKLNQIIENANLEAKNIIDNANDEAKTLIETTQKENQQLIEQTQASLEEKTAQAAREGYEDGYQDAQSKFLEEMQEKIEDFNKFCEIQSTLKDKILKNASRDMLNLVQALSKSIILSELNGEILDKVIKKTIEYFEQKEDITIVLSKKYAQMLFEFQKKNFDVELNFAEFSQYENFKIAYNSQIDEDTIIVENNKERFDASISNQLEVVIREIYEKTKNGVVDVEEYTEESSENKN